MCVVYREEFSVVCRVHGDHNAGPLELVPRVSITGAVSCRKPRRLCQSARINIRATDKRDLFWDARQRR